MRRWTLRKIWLAILAAVSLALWGAMAAAVTLVAGDRLDLGIESTVREYRATAIAAWQQGRPDGAPAVAMRPDEETAERQTPAGEPTAVSWPTAYPPDLPPGGQQQAAAIPAGASEVPAQAASSAGQVTAPTPAPEAGVAASDFASVATPLLLADPPLGDLSVLDAEMARSAPGRPVQIRYLETALNEQVAALLADRTDLSYRDVRVDLGQEQVTVTGQVVVLGMEIQAEVRGSLFARECGPELEIASVRIGRLFTPVIVREQVGNLIAESLEWYPADYPLCIDRIVVQDDRATLYGHRK